MENLIPKDAAQFLQHNPDALFIDCRSDMEFRFAGHPIGALNVAWNDGPGWAINPNFINDVKRLAADTCDRPVVLICRSGERSAEAGKALESSGFSKVCTVRYGFEGDVGPNHQRGSVNGWRFDGLPWKISACGGKCGS
jgi:rhodanese-related sulfurtransferase